MQGLHAVKSAPGVVDQKAVTALHRWDKLYLKEKNDHVL